MIQFLEKASNVSIDSLLEVVEIANTLQCKDVDISSPHLFFFLCFSFISFFHFSFSFSPSSFSFDLLCTST